MKRYLLLLLALFCPQAQAGCPWRAQGGPAPHLMAGFFGTTALTAVTGAPVLSALALNALGAAKEYSDYKNGGWCSGKDLAANALGSLVGAHYGLAVWADGHTTTIRYSWKLP